MKSKNLVIICIFISIVIGWYILSRMNMNNSDNMSSIDENGKNISEEENLNAYDNYDFQKKENEDDYLEINKVYELAEAIDFTVKLEHISLSKDENIIYKKAYLELLKSNITIINLVGEAEYFKDLYHFGVEFEELDETFSYYYYDLDGDGLPELGVMGFRYTYIFKYNNIKNEFSVLHRFTSIYHTILGTGQIWYRDAKHVGIMRHRYIILDDNNEWKIAIEFEEGTQTDQEFYSVSIDEYRYIDIEEDYFIKTRERFLSAIENAIPYSTFDEVFGDVME